MEWRATAPPTSRLPPAQAAVSDFKNAISCCRSSGLRLKKLAPIRALAAVEGDRLFQRVGSAIVQIGARITTPRAAASAIPAAMHRPPWPTAAASSLFPPAGWGRSAGSQPVGPNRPVLPLEHRVLKPVAARVAQFRPHVVQQQIAVDSAERADFLNVACGAADRRKQLVSRPDGDGLLHRRRCIDRSGQISRIASPERRIRLGSCRGRAPCNRVSAARPPARAPAR